MAFINEARIAGLKPGSAPSLILFHLDMWILHGTDLACKWELPGAQCSTDCGEFNATRLIPKDGHE